MTFLVYLWRHFYYVVVNYTARIKWRFWLIFHDTYITSSLYIPTLYYNDGLDNLPRHLYNVVIIFPELYYHDAFIIPLMTWIPCHHIRAHKWWFFDFAWHCYQLQWHVIKSIIYWTLFRKIKFAKWILNWTKIYIHMHVIIYILLHKLQNCTFQSHYKLKKTVTIALSYKIL